MGNEWERIYRSVPLQELPWHSERPARALVQLLRKKGVRAGKALDVCCGAGTNAAYLAKKGFQVTGIDISRKAVEYAAENCERRKLKCRFIVGNVLKLPFARNTFDLVFDRGCYHHMPQSGKPRFAGLIAKVLKKGGIYLLLCFSYRDEYFGRGVSKEEIRENFSKYFKIESIRPSVHREPDGTGREFYSVVMEKI